MSEMDLRGGPSRRRNTPVRPRGRSGVLSATSKHRALTPPKAWWKRTKKMFAYSPLAVVVPSENEGFDESSAWKSTPNVIRTSHLMRAQLGRIVRESTAQAFNELTALKNCPHFTRTGV